MIGDNPTCISSFIEHAQESYASHSLCKDLPRLIGAEIRMLKTNSIKTMHVPTPLGSVEIPHRLIINGVSLLFLGLLASHIHNPALLSGGGMMSFSNSDSGSGGGGNYTRPFYASLPNADEIGKAIKENKEKKGKVW